MTPTIQAALEAIDARVKAATPEEWYVEEGPTDFGEYYIAGITNQKDDALVLELLNRCPTDLAALTSALRIAVEALEFIKANSDPCGAFSSHLHSQGREALASIERIIGGEKG